MILNINVKIVPFGAAELMLGSQPSNQPKEKGQARQQLPYYAPQDTYALGYEIRLQPALTPAYIVPNTTAQA